MGLSPMTHASSQSHDSTVGIVNLLEGGVHVAGRPLHVFILHSAQTPVPGDTSGGRDEKWRCLFAQTRIDRRQGRRLYCRPAPATSGRVSRPVLP